MRAGLSERVHAVAPPPSTRKADLPRSQLGCRHADPGRAIPGRTCARRAGRPQRRTQPDGDHGDHRHHRHREPGVRRSPRPQGYRGRQCPPRSPPIDGLAGIPVGAVVGGQQTEDSDQARADVAGGPAEAGQNRGAHPDAGGQRPPVREGRNTRNRTVSRSPVGSAVDVHRVPRRNATSVSPDWAARVTAE